MGSEDAQKAIKQVSSATQAWKWWASSGEMTSMHWAMCHLGLVPVLEGKTRHEEFPDGWTKTAIS